MKTLVRHLHRFLHCLIAPDINTRSVDRSGKRLVLGGVLALSLLAACSITAAKARVSASDPTGDAYDAAHFSDYTSLAISEFDTFFQVELSFVDIEMGAYGTLLLDVDGNRRTRLGGLAADAIVEINAHRFGICTALYIDARQVEPLNCLIQAHTLYLAIPKSYIGAEFSNLSFAATVSSNGTCGGWDRVPDRGYLRMTEGDVDEKDLVGTPISREIRDGIAGDAEAPVDLSAWSMDYAGEYLITRLSYKNSIDPYVLDEPHFGGVSLDLDGELLTGFQNAVGAFPTFGVDAYIYYELYHSVLGGGSQIDLLASNPQEEGGFIKLVVGARGTDSCFHRGQDTLEIRLPLASLIPIQSEAVGKVKTVCPAVFCPPSYLTDSIPNDGGTRFSDGSHIPFLSCLSKTNKVTDAAYDSFAFGKDNDELIDIEACHYEKGMLVLTRYKNWTLDGRSFTAVHFDLDKDAGSGEKFRNNSGDTTLGVEKTAVYKLSALAGGSANGMWVEGFGFVSVDDGGITGGAPFFTGILVEGATGDLIKPLNQFYTMDFGTAEVYATYPYELLDGSLGFNLHAWTMSGTFGVGTLADEIPDSSVLSLPDANLQPDPDGDGSPDHGKGISRGANFLLLLF